MFPSYSVNGLSDSPWFNVGIGIAIVICIIIAIILYSTDHITTAVIFTIISAGLVLLGWMGKKSLLKAE